MHSPDPHHPPRPGSASPLPTACASGVIITTPVHKRELTRDGMDALRCLQTATRAEVVAAMHDSPDTAWLRHAMGLEDTLIQSLGIFWMDMSGRGRGQRWPAVIFWVTPKGGRRRGVVVYPTFDQDRRGGYRCLTRDTDTIIWAQYAGVASQRPAWLDGEVGPESV